MKVVTVYLRAASLSVWYLNDDLLLNLIHHFIFNDLWFWQNLQTKMERIIAQKSITINSAFLKIITDLHSKDLVFKAVFHSYDGSIWSFSYETQNLTEKMHFVGVSALLSLTCWGRGYLVVLLFGDQAVRELRQEGSGYIHLWRLGCVSWRQQEFGGRWSAGCRQRKYGRVPQSVSDGVPHVWEEANTEAARSSCATFLCETHLCLKGYITQRIYPKDILYTFLLLILLLSDFDGCEKHSQVWYIIIYFPSLKFTIEII